MQGGSAVSDELGMSFKALIDQANTPPEDTGPDPMQVIKEQEVAIKGMLAEHKIEIENERLEWQSIVESQRLQIEQFKARMDASEKAAEEMRLSQKHEMQMAPKMLQLEAKMADIEKAKIELMATITEARAKQLPQQQEPQAPAEPKPDNTAAILTAVASMLQGMPQPVVNVEAPRPTKRVGTIQKTGDTARIVVEEEDDG
jgi:hypothetical protein